MCNIIDTLESTSPLHGGSGTCHKSPLTRSPVVDVTNGFIRQQERPIREAISVCNITIISASSMKNGQLEMHFNGMSQQPWQVDNKNAPPLKPPQKTYFFSPSLRFEYREESSSSRPIYSSTEAGYHSPIQSRTLADAWAESVWNAKILGPKPLVFGSRPECQNIRKRGPIQHV